MHYRIEDIPSEEQMYAAVARMQMLMPAKRVQKALAYKPIVKQYSSLRVWEMLWEMLVAYAYIPKDVPLSELDYTEDLRGKPSVLLPNGMGDGICFSLSHTGCALAVAIDHSPIGIDVEGVVRACRLADGSFVRYTMSDAEQRKIAEATDKAAAFTLLWTQKEALCKAAGTGIVVSELRDMLMRAHPYTFVSEQTERYACSVAFCADKRL